MFEQGVVAKKLELAETMAMLTGSGHLRNKRPLVVSGHF
jgi:hypothetical protein